LTEICGEKIIHPEISYNEKEYQYDRPRGPVINSSGNCHSLFYKPN